MPKPKPKIKNSHSARLKGAPSKSLEAINASVDFDRRLYAQDIAGSLAHAQMLERIGVLTRTEFRKITSGLKKIEREIAQGDFVWRHELEDVHMNIEARLIKLVGEAGKKLHTGRSRNDQVATDLRLWLRDAQDELDALLLRLLVGLVNLADAEADTPMPGFTHLQPAQPVTFGHHMLAWVEMLERDRERLADCRGRLNRSPLGAGALAGTGFPLDRRFTARQLGFSEVTRNSLDSVSDRDFAVEFNFVAALLMVHLSRMAEELVLWCAPAYGFVSLPDGFCTGSSMMPQKKNPDIPELIRGKSGRAIGNLNALLVMLKGQPLAYNKDNQEDKEPVFDSVQTLRLCLSAFADMVPGIVPNREVMRAAALEGHTTATDLADYLVAQGLGFRDAHAAVASVVRLAERRGVALHELPLEELRKWIPNVDKKVYRVLSLEGALNARSHIGGTAPRAVRKAVKAARQRLDT